MKTALKIYALALVTFLLGACANLPTTEVLPIEPPGVVAPKPRIALTWEKANASRASWSDAITAHFGANLPLYSKAKDVTRFCPKYHSLSDAQKVKALSEFWVAVAYYESSYNPLSNSVDVGVADKLDTYSVGLYQMSVVDQNWAPVPGVRYTFADLKKPVPNINLASVVLKRQITKYSEFFIVDGVYWAVIRDGDSFVTRQSYCAANPKTCAASKWKTGWCAMSKGACRLTRLPDVLSRTKANVPECQ